MGSLNFQDVIRDVHDPANHALQISGTINAAGQATVSLLGTPTVMVGTPTLYAVVNTSAAGVGNSIVTINPRTDYIGLVSVSGNVVISNATLYAVVNTGAAGVGNSIVTIEPRTDYFGLVSVSGNVAVSALPETPVGTKFIGLATVWNANQQALVASTVNIGSVSVLGGGIGINAGVNGIGFATVKVDTGTKYIGLATVDMGVNKAWADPNTFIGLVTVAPHSLTASTLNIGSVSVLGGGIGINAGVNSIGFATVWALNVGTNKSLVNLPIGFSVASVATIAVPTNANTIKISNMLLNSDATVRFTIKSGVTYLTGNASIGITLNPGGGFIMTGSPDSPSWIGLPSGALVVEKLDLTGTSAKIAGNVVYWQE